MIIKPPIYHGILFPILVLVISERWPTIGVAIASAIWPDSIAIDAASVQTTNFK